MIGKTLLFLCSGGGGNLRFIHQAIQHKWLPDWEHIVVITDRECHASNYARQQGLSVSCVDFEEDCQATLTGVAQLYAPDIVITTVHRILGDAFLAAFKGKMLNLHYSLLPSFAGSIGTNTVKAAMDYGVRLGGATVHEVVAEVDAGRPVAQIVFTFAPEDDFVEVMDVEFRAGCIALLGALRIFSAQVVPDWRGSILQIKGRNALINPASVLPEELFREDFWSLLK